jgi:hypothetical protein
MIGTMLAGVAGIIAAPAVGGLVWRRARQRRVAKALEITTPTWPWPRWHRRGGRHQGLPPGPGDVLSRGIVGR